MSQFFASAGQSIGASASASVLPMNSRLISFKIDWFDLLAVLGSFFHPNSSPYCFLCYILDIVDKVIKVNSFL